MRELRAWLWSTVACVGFLMLLVSSQQLLTGRWSWHNVLDMPLAFGAFFAIVVVVAYCPIYLVLERVLAQPLTRRNALLAALLLSPTTTIVIQTAFRERWEPNTIAEWSRYILSHPVELFAASVPFAFAGTIFAWVWTRRPRQRQREGRAECAV
jgi:branched-subunit amino acid ABC-type transport system permease component